MTAQRRYRFATREQWGVCRLQGFDLGASGGIVPAVRLGTLAVRADDRAASVVAAGPHGDVTWRLESGAAADVCRRDATGIVAGPFELDAIVADSSRLVLDVGSLWAFDPDDAMVRRYDADRLELSFTVDPIADATILDMASDGRGGVWLLFREREGGHRLRHVDAHGYAGHVVPAPCEAVAPHQIACVDRGRQLVLLSEGGQRLVSCATDTGAVTWVVVAADVLSGWIIERLAGDARGRLALWGTQRRAHMAPRVALAMLAASGEPYDGPLFGLLPAEAEVHDLTVARDVVWFAATCGLYRLDGSEECIPREQDAIVLTPALVSEPTGDARGWLRAEVAIDLPAGAELIAEYAGTDDLALVERVAIAPGAEPAQHLAEAWDAIVIADPDAGLDGAPVSYAFDGPLQGPIAIPLFASAHRWLWLRIRLLVPPSTPPPRLAELSVLYPDESIARDLPRVFQGPDGDPRGSLRTLAGVIEATTQDIDARIRTLGGHVDPVTAPEPWLDILADWLDVPWDRGLPMSAKRALLASAGDLLTTRGTRRGLVTLLGCLLGHDASVSVSDVVVERPVVWVGGGGCAGSALPGLLAGAPRCAPTVGGKAVLGRARLGANADPMHALAAVLMIRIAATRELRTLMAPMLERLLSWFVPAGMSLRIRWQPEGSSAAGDDTLLVIDTPSAARLGRDHAIGRAAVAGAPRQRLSDEGFDVDFMLH